jgi:hypothetical protein
MESILRSLPPVEAEWLEADEVAEAQRLDREIESGQVQALNDAEFWRQGEADRKR